MKNICDFWFPDFQIKDCFIANESLVFGLFFLWRYDELLAATGNHFVITSPIYTVNTG